MKDKQLLILDDDEHFAHALSLGLKRAGFVISQANNIEQALHISQQQIFDYALVDLNLGDQSGLQIIAPLRELQPQIKIIMLTGYASITSAVKAIKLGADHYLTKPVQLKDILNTIEHELNTSSPKLKQDEKEHNPMSIKRLEWEHLQKVLDEHNGNISATAKALGMHRRTLQRKLQKRPVNQ